MSELVSELKKLKIIKKGKFTLKSGKVSDFYIDMKKAFGSPETFRIICDGLCRMVDKKATCVAGSGHGGLPLATAVSLRLGLPLVLVRDGLKDHGVKKIIDGYIPSKKDRIVLVDDVFTTGTCILNIISALSETKSKILAGYVVVNRDNTSKFPISIKSLLTSKELTFL